MAQNSKKQIPNLNDFGAGNNPNKKVPRFNVTWIWAFIGILILTYTLFKQQAPDTSRITEQEFTDVMLAKGDVSKFEKISNKELVRVYIKTDSLFKPFYQSKFKGIDGGKAALSNNPLFEFRIVDWKSFDDDMKEFYAAHPNVERVPFTVRDEDSWLSGPIPSALFSIVLIMVAIVLMTRKMGGGPGGGG
ncbi:MAG: AAA family ATPase, partial [Chitinophagaceae bacterium]|nr:AAA family ATPase [Chitinophagaceae bacterium]